LVPYLLIADLQNTALSAVLTFSDRILYHSYAAAPRLFGLSALEDQVAAGAIMWVAGSLAFVVPAVIIAIEHLSRRSPPAELITSRKRESSSRAALYSPSCRATLGGTGEQASAPVPVLSPVAREALSGPGRSRPLVSRCFYRGGIRLTRVPRTMEAAWLLVFFVATGLCLIKLLGGATDDDWVPRFTQTSGSFAVTVFGKAGDTSAGPTAFSILAQNPTTQEVLLEATVNVGAHACDKRLATFSDVQASSEHSQNRLFQTAVIDLATEGPWIVSITLKRNSEITEFSFPVYVVKADKGFKIPWSHLLLAALGLILALVYVRRHRPAELRAAHYLALHRQPATARGREDGNV